MRDVRHAVRFLRRHPGSTILAVATLALAIGAGTLVFSVADAALFKPLPYRDPDRLVDFRHVQGRGTSEQTFVIGTPFDEARAWRAQNGLFEGVELFGGGGTRALQVGDSREDIAVGRLSPGMLPLLGVSPQLGRGFTAGDAMPGRDHVILLSDGLWRASFNASRSVLGRVVRLDGEPYTIVGVAPKTFRFRPAGQAKAWMPMTDSPAAGAGFVGTIARLRPGLTLVQANRDARAAAAWIGQRLQHPRTIDIELFPIDDMRTGDETRTTVMLALGAVACLLLIACANVGNLLLAHATARRREFAVRTALGASRLRLLRQSITEALVLATAGALGGVALAAWGHRVVAAITPARMGLFGVYDLELDTRVLTFAAALTLVTAVVSGAVPLLRAGVNVDFALHGARATRRWMRSGLLAIQIALTMVLLIDAGLLASSLVRMVSAPEGYPAGSVAYATLGFPRETTRASRAALFERLLPRLRALPGVRDASVGTPPPLGLYGGFAVEGRRESAREPGSVSIQIGDTRFFSTTGVRIRAGRAFSADDRATAPPVAVISTSAAHRYWPDGHALGARIRYSPYVDWITVVGIADDVKTNGLASHGGNIQVYLPLAQQEFESDSILIRADDGRAVLSQLRGIVVSTDAGLAIRESGIVRDLYQDAYTSPRFFLSFMSLFALSALGIAALGLAASLAYDVSRRTKEIGVRMALGADTARVRRLVIRDACAPVAGGLALGFLAAFWLTRLLASMLYGVGAHDPLTIGAAACVLLGVAAASAYVPARRATAVDPMIVLRVD